LRSEWICFDRLLVFPAGGWATPPETIVVDADEPLEIRASTPVEFDLVLVAPELAGGCKYTSNHSWINQAPEWLGSIKRRGVL
jgi:hypothetical protein